MAIAIRPPKPVAPTAIEITVPRVMTEQVWQQQEVLARFRRPAA
jgi:hypothetical protein